MSREAEELIRVYESLPEPEQSQVIAFARFLQSQTDDARWEELIASTQPRPKLDASLTASEPTSPLDPEML